MSTTQKIAILVICFICSVIGFLIKIPVPLRGNDKFLHTAFYFLAAGFLNILFANKKIVPHVCIFIVLLLFGTAIEYAQEYSNKLFHVKIHGRFDPEDIKANLKGLIAFSIVWFVYVGSVLIYRKAANDAIGKN